MLQTTVCFSARSNCKDADLWKLRATEIHLSAAQKFLSDVTGLCTRNVDHGVCVTKLRSIERCKYLEGLLVAGSKTYFDSWPHWYTATAIFPWISYSSGVTWDFYARLYRRRNASLLHVCPSVYAHVSVRLSLEGFPCKFVL